MRRMSLDAPKFTERFIKGLHALLSERDGVYYEINHEGYIYPDTYWFVGPETDSGSAELRIALGQGEVIISRVLFTNRRQGVMTSLFNYLRGNAIELGYGCVRIESVCTPEMVSWCSKNGFRVLEATASEFDGITFGDYIKDV